MARLRAQVSYKWSVVLRFLTGGEQRPVCSNETNSVALWGSTKKLALMNLRRRSLSVGNLVFLFLYAMLDGVSVGFWPAWRSFYLQQFRRTITKASPMVRFAKSLLAIAALNWRFRSKKRVAIKPKTDQSATTTIDIENGCQPMSSRNRHFSLP